MRMFAVLLILVVLAVAAVIYSRGRCLVEGTPVQTPDGPRLVETLNPGDLVLSLDADGQTVPATIVAVRKGTAFSWTHLTFADGRTLAVTSTHPLGTSGGWTPAGDLRRGHRVRTSAGEVAVVRNEARLGPVTVYDLSVEPTQTFLAGGVLVHNKSVSTWDRRAIGDIRIMIDAQHSYASASGGYFDRIECLVDPTRCLRGYSVDPPVFLRREFLEAERSRYRFTFVPGPPPDAPGALSPSAMTTFAYTAVPLDENLRSFCGDSTGRVCFHPDGREPEVEEGLCAASCQDFR